MPDELCNEVHDIVQETGIKTIPMEKKCKKAKWLSGEALQIAVKRREVKSLSHVQFFATPWTVAHQAPLYMKFSRQEYWSGLPFPSPGDLSDLRIEPGSPVFQVDSLLPDPPGKHTINISHSTDGKNIVQRSQVICPHL